MRIITTISFPERVWRQYLHELNISTDTEALTRDQQQYLLLRCLRDFYDWVLSADDVAALGRYLCSRADEVVDEALSRALNAASELDYYIRAVGDSSLPTAALALSDFLAELHRYYRQNRSALRRARGPRAA